MLLLYNEYGYIDGENSKISPGLGAFIGFSPLILPIVLVILCLFCFCKNRNTQASIFRRNHTLLIAGSSSTSEREPLIGASANPHNGHNNHSPNAEAEVCSLELSSDSGYHGNYSKDITEENETKLTNSTQQHASTKNGRPQTILATHVNQKLISKNQYLHINPSNFCPTHEY